MHSVLMKEGYAEAVAPVAGVDKTATTFVSMDQQALVTIRLALYIYMLRRV